MNCFSVTRVTASTDFKFCLISLSLVSILCSVLAHFITSILSSVKRPILNIAENGVLSLWGTCSEGGN